MNLRPPAALLALAIAALLAFAACSDGDSAPSEAEPLAGEWPTVGQNLARTGVNPAETLLTRETAGDLVMKWKFQTGGPVASSPTVATVDLAEGPERLVFVGSYDGFFYAIRASDGTEVWRYEVKPHLGISYGAIASTATVAVVDGEQRVYFGAGMTLYALDAGTGAEVLQFDAGDGCTTCDASAERNEILSSPAVLPDEDMVLFGMDVNDNNPGKGGFYAISAAEGTLRWYFDLETGATCRTDGDDEVRKFDGFHTAEQLGLDADFFETRDGCDFDRTETGCGGVWSPVSVDTERELIYFSSTNCDTDDDPATAEPEPPMPLHDEALVVLDYDGTPAWTWRPREVDNDDLAFGAAPNLFVAEIDGVEREVVGLGGKDGTYYLLDRDGENEITGEIEPYWQTNVVAGGSIGGMTGSPAVQEGRVFFGTAIGEDVAEWQTPSSWALDASTGEVAWTQEAAAPFYGATGGVPGIVFMGGVDATLRAFDTSTGEILFSAPLNGIIFSSAAIVDGEVFIGAGFGASEAATGNEEAQERAKIPAGVFAFCIEGVNGCEEAPTPTTAE